MQFSLAQRQTSQPIPVIAGTVITVSPDLGATALVEYTSGSLVDIANGAAAWSAWPLGTVIATARDTRTSAAFMRVTTTGGMVAVNVDDSPAATSAHPIAYAPSGDVEGIVGRNGRMSLVGVNDWVESQWTRALLVAPPPRQINAVKDLSVWMNDGQYLNSAADADIYDSYAAYTPAAGTKPAGNWLGTGYTNTGGSQTAVGTLAAASKALMLHQSKCQWDLNAGESLLIQHRFFIADNGTANTIGGTTPLFGSCTASMTVQGLYANVSAAGALTVGLRSGAATPANQATAVNAVPLLTNTPYCLTLHIDGGLKTINAWINGQQLGSQTNIAVTGDTTVTPTNYSTLNPNNGGSHMGVGCYQTDANAPTGWNPQRLFTSHFRMTVLPGGLALMNPGLIDYLFNRNPDRFMSDAALVGAY